MRDIIFRAKSFPNGKWVYGSLIAMDSDIASSQVFIFTPYNGASSLPCSFLVSNNMEAVDPETVGQYTGLTDKNGKKIFEGDICTIRIPKIYGGFDEHTHSVWKFERGCFICEDYTGSWWHGDSYGYEHTASENIEVIGNIHDNPELLGGADNGE